MDYAKLANKLLQDYPRETLHFLRDQRKLGQKELAAQLNTGTSTVGRWEAHQRKIAPYYRRDLIPMLTPLLRTPFGEAWVQMLLEREEAREETE